MRLLIKESKLKKNKEVYFQKISLTRIPIRLGKDVFSTGIIRSDTKDKLIMAMKAFKLLMKINDVEYHRACATSAMREAKNGVEVQKEINRITAIDLEIIKGKIEADLIFLNFHLADLKSKNYLYIDVGGGSTELTIIKDKKRIASKSFKIGSVRQLTDRSKKNMYKDAFEWINKHRPFNEEIEAIGSGGSINKLYSHSSLTLQEPLAIDELRKIISRISSFSYEDRIRILKLKPNRADVIVPGGNIYLSIMDAANVKKIIVPNLGLADGMIYQLYLEKEGVDT